MEIESFITQDLKDCADSVIVKVNGIKLMWKPHLAIVGYRRSALHLSKSDWIILDCFLFTMDGKYTCTISGLLKRGDSEIPDLENEDLARCFYGVDQWEHYGKFTEEKLGRLVTLNKFGEYQ